MGYDAAAAEIQDKYLARDYAGAADAMAGLLRWGWAVLALVAAVLAACDTAAPAADEAPAAVAAEVDADPNGVSTAGVPSVTASGTTR